MQLDFSGLGKDSAKSNLVDPAQIYSALPSKHPKYAYLRNVQGEVLDQWTNRREERDLRIKMNTGSGKTIVGLLILQSSLNDGKGPAVYIAPSPVLKNQAILEAKGLGIDVVSEPTDSRFQAGNSILVTTVNVLINGRSQFGVSPDPPKLEIGTIVFDDAHACLASAEQQFSISVESTSPIYKDIFGIFQDDLEKQNYPRFLEVHSKEPGKMLQVRFWSLQKNIDQVTNILYHHRDSDELRFSYPLLANSLKACRFVFGNGKLEITPPCLPVSAIPSLAHAKRRVFMSATFSDDNILVTHFGAAVGTIQTAIAPRSASDLGERMILIPQELNPVITDDDIKEYAKSVAKTKNVVVIVPSNYRSDYWKKDASKVVAAGEIEKTVESLRSGHVGLVVFVNRYDGIDLPDDACRLLILDGMPDVRLMIDKLEQANLYGTPLSHTKAIQMIEQGMGRGIRSNEDSCAVILMGRSLVGNLFSHNAVQLLTPATRRQFEVSQQLSSQLRNKGMDEIAKALQYCLNRESEWVAAHKNAMAGIKYDVVAGDLSIASAKRKAFDAFEEQKPNLAVESLSDCRRAESNTKLKGWLGFQMAEYENMIDPVEAQKILASAVVQNSQLAIRPIEGFDYKRISSSTKVQSEICLEFLRSEYEDSTSLIVAFNAICDDLQFAPGRSDSFERAFKDLAFYLGFVGQRPEEEFGAGPDNLWSLGELKYLVVECKSEATSDEITKEYCNQLNGSAQWFEKSYDKTCTYTAIMIHPSTKISYAASLADQTRIIARDDLPRLVSASQGFISAIAPNFRTYDAKTISEYLTKFELTSAQLEKYFSKHQSNR